MLTQPFRLGRLFSATYLLVLAFVMALAGQCVPSVRADVIAGSENVRLNAADRAKIQRVINLQIRAFEKNDDALAFSYSTPETRKLFGSSRSFMALVREEYSVLYQHSSREFLEAALIDGEVIQPLRIVSREGEIVVALYSLKRQPDREWRISGCELAPSTLQAA